MCNNPNNSEIWSQHWSQCPRATDLGWWGDAANTNFKMALNWILFHFWLEILLCLTNITHWCSFRQEWSINQISLFLKASKCFFPLMLPAVRFELRSSSCDKLALICRWRWVVAYVSLAVLTSFVVAFGVIKVTEKMLTSLVLEAPVIFQLASFLKSVVEKN